MKWWGNDFEKWWSIGSENRQLPRALPLYRLVLMQTFLSALVALLLLSVPALAADTCKGEAALKQKAKITCAGMSGSRTDPRQPARTIAATRTFCFAFMTCPPRGPISGHEGEAQTHE